MSAKLTHYRPDRPARPQSRTDWKPLERMTDAEIDRAARSDRDAQPVSKKALARAFRPGAIAALRHRLRLSQTEFANEFNLSLRTLQDWEQGRRAPDHIARLYLRVIERDPDAVRAAILPAHAVGPEGE